MTTTATYDPKVEEWLAAFLGASEQYFVDFLADEAEKQETSK